MSTTLAPPQTAAAGVEPGVPPRKSPPARLMSLDAYRGAIMLTLISHGFGFAALQSYPGWSWLAGQVDHTDWVGVTFWDLIQPAFTFMVGVAMPFALAGRISRGADSGKLLKHVLWRAAMLILLSNFLSNFGSTHPHVQFINVLCQIAFGYALCFLITRLRFSWQVVCGVAMIAGYWALFALFPGPDGAFGKTGNIGAMLDLKILGYNYPGYYTTINFIGNAATILFGCWTGMLLQSDKSHSSKLKILAAAAVAGFAIGLALAPFNPMVKRLWTASFTFFSAGWVLSMLIVFYWLIEVRRMRRLAFPFVVLGMNSIFIYCVEQIMRGWLYRGLLPFTGGGFSFLGALGAIPQNLLTLGVMWLLCYWLYRRNIFIKI